MQQTFLPGAKYLITYRDPNVHRVPRQALCVYVGEKGPKRVFHARPTLARKFAIDNRHISEIRSLPSNDRTTPFVDRTAS